MKIVTAKEALSLIKDGQSVVVGGFIGSVVPEELLMGLENLYLETKSPKNLTLFYAAGVGDGQSKGMNHLAHLGLVKRIIGGHWGLAPKLAQLAVDNKVEAYNLPQGVITHMLRDMSAGKKHTLSKIGLHTFVDPDLGGGKVNEMTTKDLVHKVDVLGETYLCYEGFPLDVAILRGTYSDGEGNICFDKEVLTLEALSMAMAVKNNGGIVIVQVEDIIKSGDIDPKAVKIPGLFVDYVVKCVDLHNHMQTFGEQYNEAYVKFTPGLKPPFTPMQLNMRKVIARRCAQLLNLDKKSLNYGIGMPEGVPSVLHEEGMGEHFLASVEPGAIGGTPASGQSFGASLSPQAIIDQPYMFDYYDGGGLDMAFLGLAQCDQFGNINVSKFGPTLAGCGGFINITQSAKELVFCGTFTAGGLKTHINEGKLVIDNEGRAKKFVKNVEQITFSAKLANLQNKRVTYVTERAVFILRENGLELVEIAPGIDLEKDILAQMDFKPMIAKDLRVMDESIFNDCLMGLKF